VTHDQVEALTMGDRVAVLKDGKLLQVDTPTKLYDDPANAFVGGFIGSPRMNFMQGVVDNRNGRLEVTIFGRNFPLTEVQVAELVSDPIGPVLVGIRPRDLIQASGSEEAVGRVRLSGVVDVTEHTGTEVYVSVQVGDQRLMATLPRHSSTSSGQPLDVEFDIEDIYLFNKESEATLLDRTAIVASHNSVHNSAFSRLLTSQERLNS
jgi:ABC-type sugar transport system ATPase subunit